MKEFQDVCSDFYEGRWRSAGLNGGRFCEIAYSVVVGVAEGVFAEVVTKPANFRAACQRLDTDGRIPKSFRFIVLPHLVAVYEIRNSRDIGHVINDIDPSYMDSSVVLASVKWIMAEFIRYFNAMPAPLAQSAVDSLSQYVSPVIWSGVDVKRVLETQLSLDMKILTLLSSNGGQATRDQLFDWLDEATRSTFNRRLALLHASRAIEAKAFGSTIQILPPGTAKVAEYIRQSTPLAA